MPFLAFVFVALGTVAVFKPDLVRKALGLCCDDCAGGKPCGGERAPSSPAGEPVQPTVNQNPAPNDPYDEDDGEALSLDAMEYTDADTDDVDLAEVVRTRIGGGPGGAGDVLPAVDAGEYDV
jgi:hypothetical protein